MPPLETLTSARPPRRSTPSRAVFDALARRIMLGELAPGEALVELDLAENFGCSQAPVREALLRLQEEGLVQRTPNRGTRVSGSSVDETRELLSVRRMVETRGAARAVRAGRPELAASLGALVERMEASAAEGDEFTLAEADRLFHHRLFQDADLPALIPILHRALVLIHRFKIARSSARHDLRETARRHWPIVEAAAAGDVAAVVERLDHHIATIVDFGPEIVPDGGAA